MQNKIKIVYRAILGSGLAFDEAHEFISRHALVELEYQKIIREALDRVKEWC